MKKMTYAILMTVSLFLFSNGCDQPSATRNEAGSGQSHSPDDGHDHGDDGHSDAGHSHEGPHDGTVVEWGDHEYHVEFLVDHDNKQATVYILDDDVKTPIPISTSEIVVSIKEPAFQVTLNADPLDGESAEKSSRFVGTHDSLETVAEYEGVISAVIDGTPYSGNFKEESHEH